MYYEKKHKGEDTEESKRAREDIAKIKQNRNWGQPYVRTLSHGMPFARCMLIQHIDRSLHGMRSRSACSCCS